MKAPQWFRPKSVLKRGSRFSTVGSVETFREFIRIVLQPTWGLIRIVVAEEARNAFSGTLVGESLQPKSNNGLWSFRRRWGEVLFSDKSLQPGSTVSPHLCKRTPRGQHIYLHEDHSLLSLSNTHTRKHTHTHTHTYARSRSHKHTSADTRKH